MNSFFQTIMNPKTIVHRAPQKSNRALCIVNRALQKANRTSTSLPSKEGSGVGSNDFSLRIGQWTPPYLLRALSMPVKVFALLLALVLSVNMWGETYTISFVKGTTNGTNISTQLPTNASTMCQSGSDYIASFSGTYAYYNSNGCGIRLAKSGDAGSLTITLSDDVKTNVKEVIIYASAVASGNTLDVTPAGTVTTKTTFSSLSTYSTSAAISTYAQSAISIKGTLTSLTFGATSKKYVHLHQIDIITAASSKTALDQVSNLSAGTPSATSATISWTGISDSELDGYKVEYKKNSESTWTIAIAKTTETTYTLSSLTPSTTYNYRVTSVAKSTSSTKKDSDPQAGTNFTTAAPAKHKVYFSANGTIINTGGTEVTEGNAINFPATATGCEGKTFMGWYGSNYSHATDAPTYVTSAIMGGSDVTYYAVFADEEEGDASTTFTFNGEILGTGGYKDADFEWGGIDFKRSQMYYNNSGAQIKASNNGFWNSEAFPGAIKQIKVTATQNDATLYVGASAKATTSSNSISKGAERTIDFSTSNNYKYLYIKSGSSYTVITTLTVTYVGVTYSNYTTTCATKYSISADATNGSILWSLDGEDFSSTIDDQIAGTSIFFKLQPNAGYEISGTPSLSTGGDITDMGNGIYGFDMPAASVTISATFVQPAKYIIDYDKGNFQSATGEMPEITEVNPGTNYTVSPNTLSLTGYTSKGWNTNKDATTGLTNIIVNDNITLYAIFTINSYNVTFNPSISGGSIKVNNSSVSPVNVQYNNSVNITVTPTHSHYKLTTLTYNGTDIKDAKSFTMPAADVTIEAEFTEDPKYTITFVDAVHGESVTPKSVYENETFTFPSITDKTAVAPTGDCMADHYHFIGWVEEGTTPTQSPSNVITAGTTSVKITEDVTYKAVWAKEEL